MRVIQIPAPGGPDVLRLTDVPSPALPDGHVRVAVAAAGVNFIDTYHRTGLYPVPMPFVPGSEGAGLVREVGAGVTGVAVGDRVAWAGVPGSYAEEVLVPVARIAPVPDGVDLPVAAASMLQGMTAHYLTHSTFPLSPAHTCLVLAAAGGTGQLLCQMARQRGARVIGTVSTDEKEALARAAGALEVIRYDRVGFAAEARRLTGGRGVDVVYDGVGRTTFDESLSSLALRGMLVLFGASSGPVPPFDPAILNTKGSLYLTRPSLFHYVATREEYLLRAGDVLGAVARGELRVRISHTFPLAEAAEAHRVLEGRGSTGKILLVP
ncbi:MAG: quinone oxidoreductase [Pseudomonadota bacterium]|nr:quinone oxidoreductase [Pseudomonadota bacterium]